MEGDACCLRSNRGDRTTGCEFQQHTGVHASDLKASLPYDVLLKLATSSHVCIHSSSDTREQSYSLGSKSAQYLSTQTKLNGILLIYINVWGLNKCTLSPSLCPHFQNSQRLFWLFG